MIGVAASASYFWITTQIEFIARRRLHNEECATRTIEPYSREGQNDRLLTFFEFAGMRFGDGRDDITAVYGSPEYEDGSHSSVELTYLNNAVTFFLYDDVLSIIRLTNRFALLGGPGIAEPRAKYLGQHANNVFDDFGPPHAISSGNYKYRFSGKSRRGFVEFTCYEHDECLCSTIEVRWPVP